MEQKPPASAQAHQLPDFDYLRVANLEKINCLYPFTTLDDIRQGRNPRQELVAGIATFYGIDPTAQPDAAEAMLQELRLNPAAYRAYQEAVAAKALACALQRKIGELCAALYTNQLTGLPNKLAFDKMLHDTISAAAKAKQGVVLLAIDIDRFKEVNDRFSYAHGDELLKRVATALGGVARKTDNVEVFHLHGDEFAIIVTGLPNEDPHVETFANHSGSANDHMADRRGQKAMTNIQRGEAIKQRLRAAVMREFAGDYAHLGLGVSIGVTVASGSYWPSAAELVRLTEDDLHCDKQANRRARLRQLPWRRRIADWLGRHLLTYAGTYDQRIMS